MADMLDTETTSHKESRPSNIQKMEEDIMKVMETFNGFLNPFSVGDRERLYCVSSGVPAPKEVAEDLLGAQATGRQSMEDFISSRLIDKKVSFYAPIKRVKLRTFESMAVSRKAKSSQNKVVELKAEKNLFGQLIVLAVKHQIDLLTTFEYPLGPVPWALATADGSPYKSDKAKLLHVLEASSTAVAQKPANQSTAYVCDGNALLHSLLALPENFGQVAERVFGALPSAKRVDFVTDTYYTKSIKEAENERRGQSEKFIINGPMPKTPRDWGNFLKNKDNKEQLVQLLLLSEWQKPTYAKRMYNRNIYFVSRNICYMLSSTDGEVVSIEEVELLRSSQEEADTRMILHCHHIASTSEIATIQIRSPDTDVFILLLVFSREIDKDILFDTGVGNKRRLLNVTEIAQGMDEDLLEALHAFHAFTGCDSTSFFVGRGKKTAWHKLRANPQYLRTFVDLGGETFSSKTVEELESFVCLMYGKSQYSDVNKLRHDMFLEKFSSQTGSNLLTTCNGVDLSYLPPCRSSLALHTKRSRYQALIWNSSTTANPSLPEPVGHGWMQDASGKVTVMWIDGPMLPQQLTDILVKEGVGEDNSEVEYLNLDDEIFDNNA